MEVFDERFPDSLRIHIHCQRARKADFSAAYEISDKNGMIFKKCIGIQAHSEKEACIVALTIAVGDVIRECPQREKYKSIHILCGNSVLADSLPKARSSPLKQWMTRRLLMCINELSDIAVVTHYFSQDLGEKINNYSYLSHTNRFDQFNNRKCYDVMENKKERFFLTTTINHQGQIQKLIPKSRFHSKYLTRIQ